MIGSFIPSINPSFLHPLPPFPLPNSRVSAYSLSLTLATWSDKPPSPFFISPSIPFLLIPLLLFPPLFCYYSHSHPIFPPFIPPQIRSHQVLCSLPLAATRLFSPLFLYFLSYYTLFSSTSSYLFGMWERKNGRNCGGWGRERKGVEGKTDTHTNILSGLSLRHTH